MSRHIPVLLNEVLEVLSAQPGDVVLDATLGGGGHAGELLKRVGKQGYLLGLDADSLAVEQFNANIKAENAKAVRSNFKDLKEAAAQLPKIDVILFDFGLSSDQLDNPERGFSFQADGPLDMRLDTVNQTLTAAQIVNVWSEQDLAGIIKTYGEEFNAKRIARAIVKTRKIAPIKTTSELFQLIKHALPAPLRFKAGDVARRTFQALRIAVNDELKVIEQALKQAFEILSPQGRLAAISFHSLEDRIVKQFFNEVSKGCICPPNFPICNCGHESQAIILTRKPITASTEEQKINSRSASAKLRAIRKIK